ncbi:BACON domain-containing protein [Candidatus Symbiothrix dinenymphae]|uniref:BACON domain-containing protein n=1 Tax=Candidatus Symbiothrix dinenymphae TaxID=467085 RepID=UPI0006E38820|nr:BACON domain-containing carbohydrate-binding protein [Candidatus Symbiothrix dinenymphae]
MAASVLLCACGNEDETPVTPPPSLSVNKDTVTANKDAGTYQIGVSSNVGWTAAVDASSAWCTISPTSGNGNATITVTLEANPTVMERTATVTIHAATLQKAVTIIQEVGDTTLLVSPTFIYPETNNAVTSSITVTSNVEWTTEIEYIVDPDWLFPDRTWCTLQPSSGVGSGVITVNLSNNPNARRLAIVSIKSGDLVQKDTIIQHGVLPMEDGVTINGITWATKNVAGFGAFVDLPNNIGKYYQFNRFVGYSYTDGVVVPEVNLDGDTSSDWLPINDPCPEGWRVPTYGETQNLKNSGYRYVSTDKGSWFGPDAQTATFTTPRNAVFLPTGGGLWGNNRNVENQGLYWVNRVLRDFDPMLAFEAGGYTSKKIALPIRCVKE